ncbi:MAG: CDP-paratose 2-epimerase [Candidatus Rokuibacteriota bacterium]|nr:MAG: CDP-paratose 2-epimerase [Candidatus Rokubacteria bacterium]
MTTPRSVLAIGGAGFIGSNLADAFLRSGARVTVYDNFSRPGALANAGWLRRRHARSLRIVRGDIRRARGRLGRLVDDADLVIHNAGQVAVTTSVEDPRADFEINAAGTLEILEAIRASRRRPPLIFSSTNKVYGALDGVATRRVGPRYAFTNAKHGIAEDSPLDFHSPYGCSKGAADQYVLDYARIYGLRTVVFRKSCIYGPRQFGVEDQGWVAWFTIAAVHRYPITIYGDGRQVRDVLFIEDLVQAYLAAWRRIDTAAGQAFNIGGGARNTLSLLELLQLLRELTGNPVPVKHEDWRPGDQKIFVSGIAKARKLLHWQPVIAPADGVSRLLAWVRANADLFRDFGKPRRRRATASG